MFTSTFNTECLGLIQSELEAELAEAQQWLEYLHVQANPEHQQNLLICLHRAEGALRIVALDDAAELVKTLRDAVKNLLATSTEWDEAIINTLAYPLFLIPRYSRWVQEQRFRGGPLLLNTINKLRQLAEDKSIVESQLLEVDIEATSNPLAGIKQAPDPKLKAYLVKLLPLFNKARRAIDKQPAAALNLLDKVAKQMQKITGNAPVAELFWLFGAVIEALQDGDLGLTKQRKQWLMLVEQHMTMLYKQPEQMLQRPLSKGVRREFLALLLLSGSKRERTQKLLKIYRLPALPYNDNDIRDGLQRLHRPSSETYEALYMAINENIELMRPHLEQVLDGITISEEHIAFLQCNMNQIISAVSMCELPATTELAQRCQHLLSEIATHPDQPKIQELSEKLLFLPERFRVMGDTTLSIEEKNRDMSLDDETLLHERTLVLAKQAVIDECHDKLNALEQQIEVDLVQQDYQRFSIYAEQINNVAALQKAIGNDMAYVDCDKAAKYLQQVVAEQRVDLPRLAQQLIGLRQFQQNCPTQALH